MRWMRINAPQSLTRAISTSRLVSSYYAADRAMACLGRTARRSPKMFIPKRIKLAEPLDPLRLNGEMRLLNLHLMVRPVAHQRMAGEADLLRSTPHLSLPTLMIGSLLGVLSRLLHVPRAPDKSSRSGSTQANLPIARPHCRHLVGHPLVNTTRPWPRILDQDLWLLLLRHSPKPHHHPSRNEFQILTTPALDPLRHSPLLQMG